MGRVIIQHQGRKWEVEGLHRKAALRILPFQVVVSNIFWTGPTLYLLHRTVWKPTSTIENMV
jgi:hypothetical protein